MKITVNADDLADQFGASEEQIDAAIKKAVRRTAVALQARIRKNASTGYHKRYRTKRRGHIPGTGPGPNVSTGNYRRSIQVTHDNAMGGARSTVHTNAPQARRLEYGFRGTDSLGRAHNQPPYPHWEPAMKIVAPVFQQEVERALKEAMNA